MSVTQTTFSGLMTLLLAKFMLNDAPHALGLTEKGPRVYVMYRMRCPRKEPRECGYEYWVSVYTQPEWEWCPVCGYSAAFGEFVKDRPTS